MTQGSNTNKHRITVQPLAALTMALHARQHATSSVHGVLLGQYDVTTSLITVQDAVPLSHGVPSKPIVEAAVGLLESILSGNNSKCEIVGWYTAPELLEDTRPGPVALRMAANLMSETVLEPTLIVINNAAIGNLIKGGQTSGSSSLLHAFGKDFGQQWLQSLPVTVENMESVSKAVQDAVNQNIPVNDFVDHITGPATTTWYPSAAVSKLL